MCTNTDKTPIGAVSNATDRYEDTRRTKRSQDRTKKTGQREDRVTNEKVETNKALSGFFSLPAFD